MIEQPELRDLPRADAPVAVDASSPDCARALSLLAARQDRQRFTVGELAWAQGHLRTCATCRESPAASASRASRHGTRRRLAAGALLVLALICTLVLVAVGDGTRKVHTPRASVSASPARVSTTTAAGGRRRQAASSPAARPTPAHRPRPRRTTPPASSPATVTTPVYSPAAPPVPTESPPLPARRAGQTPRPSEPSSGAPKSPDTTTGTSPAPRTAPASNSTPSPSTTPAPIQTAPTQTAPTAGAPATGTGGTTETGATTGEPGGSTVGGG